MAVVMVLMFHHCVFEKEYYEKPLLENPSEIMFSGESNNLSVEVSDDNVLEATIGAGKNKNKDKKRMGSFILL